LRFPNTEYTITGFITSMQTELSKTIQNSERKKRVSQKRILKVLCWLKIDESRVDYKVLRLWIMRLSCALEI